VTAVAAAGLVNGDGTFSPGQPHASPYVRPSDDDPELEARVKLGRKRVFISSRVWTSPDAMWELELEDKEQTRPQRGA
jgi:hypothetical protein